jgi:Zn-dependent protease with chaperone function
MCKLAFIALFAATFFAWLSVRTARRRKERAADGLAVDNAAKPERTPALMATQLQN